MRPAVSPAPVPDRVRLLADDTSSGRIADLPFPALADLFHPGDVLIVNDAATLPASLRARTEHGHPVEVRLVGPAGPPGPVGPIETTSADHHRADHHRADHHRADHYGAMWHAVLLGAGDWRTPTEHRPPPPPLAPGATLVITDNIDPAGEAIAANRDTPTSAIAIDNTRIADLGIDTAATPIMQATICAHSAISARLVTLRFDRTGAALWHALYRAGRPIQYAHLQGELALWSVQSAFAARPWAVEMPSAGRPLTGAVLAALRNRGVTLAQLTHAAGLSATGDRAIDDALPLPERYRIPAATVAAIARAKAHGGRIVAVGTSVVRALEGCTADHGAVRAGAGITDLKLGPDTRPRVVHGLLTGMHEPGTSHDRLLHAFGSAQLLGQARQRALELDYRGHEFGDSCLIAPRIGERITTFARSIVQKPHDQKSRSRPEALWA